MKVQAGLVQGGLTEVVLFQMAFIRGIRFGQVDKRMDIADKGTDS